MMFHSRGAQTTILAVCSAFMMAALGDYACADGNLDASYAISFARIRVGDITAAVVGGDSESVGRCRAQAMLAAGHGKDMSD
jgi:hypothetical protein